MPDETNIPACLGCDHQAPEHCEMCGGSKGTGGLPPCLYCLARGNPPVSAAILAMGVQRINESLYELADGAYRIELSVITRTATATEELLSNDVTATHYVAGARDATGKLIVIGEQMTYHDWLGKEREWRVYKRHVDEKTNAVWYDKIDAAANPLDLPNTK